jgi:hypothetical protein
MLGQSLLACVLVLSAAVPATSAEPERTILDSDGYVHTVPDNKHTYTLAAGTELCRDAEVMGKPMGRCYRLKRATHVRAVTTVPGITRRSVLVTSVDGSTSMGFIPLDDFPDPD